MLYVLLKRSLLAYENFQTVKLKEGTDNCNKQKKRWSKRNPPNTSEKPKP